MSLAYAHLCLEPGGQGIDYYLDALYAAQVGVYQQPDIQGQFRDIGGQAHQVIALIAGPVRNGWCAAGYPSGSGAPGPPQAAGAFMHRYTLRNAIYPEGELSDDYE